MEKTMSLEMLKRGNIFFMQIASYTMNKSPIFFDTLRRAELCGEKARYDELQSLPPPGGFIFVEPSHATCLLSAINENKNLLGEFMVKVSEVSEGKYLVRNDCSRIEVPFEDKSYGEYKISLDIFGYTQNTKGSFKPVENPFILLQSTKIERLANLELNIG